MVSAGAGRSSVEDAFLLWSRELLSPYPPPMSALVFRHAHRVTYSECTLGNHVYYGRFLDFMEEARGEFFRHLGQPFLLWQDRDTLFPAVECRLRFVASARYDDELAIEVWVSAMERVRLSFGYRIVNQRGAEILRAATDHACATVADKLQRIPEELRAALLPYLRLESNAV
jgi:acyl-CoA thioester hydrolase